LTHTNTGGHEVGAHLKRAINGTLRTGGSEGLFCETGGIGNAEKVRKKRKCFRLPWATFTRKRAT